jgi:hypothetical protein
MSKKSNIEITDSHREMYRKLYSLYQKKKEGLGFHYKNTSKIKILRELEKLGYVRYKYKNVEVHTNYKKRKYKIYYLFFESTGKKMFNKKVSTKIISKIYDSSGVEINIILRYIHLKDGWDDNIFIDGKEADIYRTGRNNYYIKFEERMYKVVNLKNFAYWSDENFYTTTKLAFERKTKILDIFSDIEL